VVIDDPRSLRDLPRAAEASGHHVVQVGEGDAPWTITLEV
jgi:TusA-related sulfurtransferase